MNNNNSSNSPSFSSSLLEQIYRSFDDGVETDFSHSRRSKLPKRFDSDDHFTARDFDSRFVLEQWMDKEEKKKRNENLISPKFRRNSMPDDGRYRHPLYYSSSSTSSSDSSSGIGGFSSSDTDSVARMKPIRTAMSSPEFNRKSNSGEIPAKKKSKKEGKLQHALKLYGDLKKVKQPISPGGKLASFLNSLFNSGNSKKPKFEKAATSSPAKMTSSSSVSVPSTASSYSRSCLSKTPSSAGRFERRSVRFCPVSVVVDETGQKSVYNDTVSKMEVCNEDNDDLKLHIMEKQRRVEEAAKELLKNYRNKQNRKELKVNIISPNHGNNNNNNYSNNINGGCIKGNNKWDNSRNNKVNLCGFEDEDEDEDDEESCCSSDLFELDNILEVGATDKYCQELPVYETTHVSINRAIANGSIL